jgi:DNA-binding response OmpR family regulator
LLGGTNGALRSLHGFWAPRQRHEKLLGDWFPQGYESKLCEQIRKFDPRSPILFISAAAYQADQQRGMDAGAQGYLTKPGGLDDLEQTISRLPDAASSITAY